MNKIAALALALAYVGFVFFAAPYIGPIWSPWVLSVASLVHPGGRSRDLAIAPDGSVWIAVISVTWGEGGLINYNPNTNVWRYWGYGTTANNWPPLIPFLINVSIQVKPNGGYLVWASYESIVVVFDSDTQLFTQLPINGNPGDVLKLPGNDCVDDLQNLWAIRIASPGIYST